ncbi:MAG: DUF4282 domain-containing protein, partial [Desulfocucumaceae bacterium]
MFWIGIAVCVISGRITIVTGVSSRYGGGAEILSGLLIIVIGPLFVRVYCELLIILFRINQTLSEIKDE